MNESGVIKVIRATIIIQKTMLEERINTEHTIVKLVFKVLGFDFVWKTCDVGINDIIFVKREVPPHSKTVLPIPSPFRCVGVIHINIETWVRTNTSHFVTNCVVRILLVLTRCFIWKNEKSISTRYDSNLALILIDFTITGHSKLEKKETWKQGNFHGPPTN